MTKHFIVKGRVQGVGYRVWTHKKAMATGLKGWVRNLRSGEVEIMACGTATQLTEFEASLYKGPVFSKVDAVISYERDQIPDEDFIILETAERSIDL